MKTMFRKILLPLLGAALAVPVASAQTVHIDDGMDDSSAPDNVDFSWGTPKGDHPENWAVWDVDPDGTTANTSFWSKGSNIIRTLDANFSPLAATPSNAEPLIFQVDMYDFMEDETGTKYAYAEMRQIHGESWQATIFAVGVWQDQSTTHYSVRAYGGENHNWFVLDVERSEGWHTFSIVLRGDTFDVFVDQDPYDPGAQPDANATNLEWAPYMGGLSESAFEAIHLGGASSQPSFAFLFDNLYLANDPALAQAIEIVQQPTLDDPYPVRDFGESVTIDVVASGTEPLTYEWTLDGEPLVNDARISGADAASVTIDDLDGPDSGVYRVNITDANDNTVPSSGVDLLALVEHERLMNANDLPGEAIEGTWTNNPASGWYGAYYAGQVAVDQPERTVTFQPEITQAGFYQIQTWFQPSYPDGNRTQEAPYIVHHAGGEDTVFINQQVPGVAEFWHDVGTFEFAAGTDGKVVLSNHILGPGGAEAAGLIFADAVRFIPTEAPPTDAPGLSVARGAAGDVELMIVGAPETEYTVEWVENLGDGWQVLGTEMTDPSGAATFVDAAVTDTASRRFYRVVAP